jgi:uncharacterized membrane protein
MERGHLMKKNSSVVFYGVVVLALIIIGYFYFNPKQTAEPKSKAETPTQVNTANSQKAPGSNSQPISDSTELKIFKSEISETAKFYPINADGTNMEVIAVKATDGTIRTALNTCQICYDSGRGYFVQEGQYLVCQNCGNRFHIDEVEKIKGGCNPVPILENDKQDKGDYISLSPEFLASQKQYFSNWGKS